MAKEVPIREGLFLDRPDFTVLIANRCKSCGQVYFPKVRFCLNCFHEELEEISLSRKGKLFTYAVVQMPASHFQPPYAVGYVDLPEGVKIFAPLMIVENKPFKVGMDMEVAVDSLWQEDDKDIVGYWFLPV